LPDGFGFVDWADLIDGGENDFACLKGAEG
jgi:hypothetical protein